MFRNAFKGFPGQVQPVKTRVVTFKGGDDSDGLGVVIKPAEGGHQLGQGILTGMAKGRVPQIMSQRHGLGQFLVQAQRSGNCPGHLGDLNGMGQAGAKIVALVLNKDLGLVLEPAKCAGMDDPVPVPLKGRAKFAFLFRMQPASAGSGITGIWLCHGLPLPCCPVRGPLYFVSFPDDRPRDADPAPNRDPPRL